MAATQIGFVEDIHQFLSVWQQLRSVAFIDFKNAWKYMQFSYIHKGSAPKIHPSQYTQALYQATLAILPKIDDINLRVGVLYTLYCLYKSQPLIDENTERIAQTMITWREMLKVYADIKERNIKDALYIWKQMREEGVYSFTCRDTMSLLQTNTNNANITSIPSDVINVDTITGVIDIGIIEDIANRYANEKKDTNSCSSLGHSFNVVDEELVDKVKELLKQGEKQQYVARQFQLADEGFTTL